MKKIYLNNKLKPHNFAGIYDFWCHIRFQEADFYSMCEDILTPIKPYKDWQYPYLFTNSKPQYKIKFYERTIF